MLPLTSTKIISINLWNSAVEFFSLKFLVCWAEGKHEGLMMLAVSISSTNFFITMGFARATQ